MSYSVIPLIIHRVSKKNIRRVLFIGCFQCIFFFFLNTHGILC